MTIRDLSTHPAHHLTVSELADYWAVSRQQIYKRIESGALAAIRIGSRIYRVPTRVALEYECRASVPAGLAAGMDSQRGSRAIALSVKPKPARASAGSTPARAVATAQLPDSPRKPHRLGQSR